MDTTDLEGCLQSFKIKANQSTRVKKLIRGWNPALIIEAIDSHDIWTMQVMDQEISDILAGKHEKNHMIHIQGNSNTLNNIFSGEVNPAEAVLDGKIAVFGNDKDQIKLDAISLVLWEN